MKRLLTVLLISSLVLVSVAVAQDDTGGAQAEMVKKKAKKLQNTASGAPQAPPPAPAPTPAQGASPGPKPGINPAQQLRISKLQSDLVATASATTATLEEKQMLQDDIANLARGASKPSSNSLDKLSETLTASICAQHLSLSDPAEIAKALNVVVNSANLTQAQAEQFVAGARFCLKQSGVGDQAAQQVADQMNDIVSELQKNRSAP